MVAVVMAIPPPSRSAKAKLIRAMLTAALEHLAPPSTAQAPTSPNWIPRRRAVANCS